MDYDLRILEDGINKWNLSLSEKQKEQFIQFYEYLIEKNKVMNLTGITEFQEVLIKHFLDSVSCVQVLDLSKIHHFLDVGTGAGFPGIPLKIMFPYVEADLLDSLQKRIHFLKDTFALLEMEKIRAFHGRAEEYAKKSEFREGYDLCISRAVSNLATLSEYCLPFVKVGGSFISYKSGNVKEELEAAQIAIQVLGGKIETVKYFQLPDTDIERSLVLIKKVEKTPGKYPRKAGTPLKEPIG